MPRGKAANMDLNPGYPKGAKNAFSYFVTICREEHAKRFPDVYWQSFGSQEGVLRVYPASQWRTVDDLPDLYDVRRRPWYIHGTSSPKDVVVLLDT